MFFLDEDGDAENICANAGLSFDATSTQICEENSHVDNLKGSKANKVDGWTIDEAITEGSWNHDFIFKGQISYMLFQLPTITRGTCFLPLK